MKAKKIDLLLIPILVSIFSCDLQKNDIAVNYRVALEKFIEQQSMEGASGEVFKSRVDEFITAQGYSTTDKYLDERKLKEASKKGVQKKYSIDEKSDCVITQSYMSFPDGSYAFVYNYSQDCAFCGGSGGMSISWWTSGGEYDGETNYCNKYLPF